MNRPRIALALLAFSAPLLASADWQALPKNSHQLYQTYALFNDHQATLAWKGSAKAWGALGGSFALFGNPDSAAHPQLVAIGSVNAGLAFQPGGGVVTDTVDARVGAAFEFALDPAYRLSLGAIHYSGQLTGSGLDRDLLSVDDHGNQLFARFLFDLGFYARAGVTFMPVIQASPDMEVFGAQEFVEFFPLGGADERTKPSPYIAVGLEQGGAKAFGLAHVFHAQVGVYLGNHFTNDHVPSARAVLGYSTGADPRLKYLHYRDSRDSFGYFGIMADL